MARLVETELDRLEGAAAERSLPPQASRLLLGPRFRTLLGQGESVPAPEPTRHSTPLLSSRLVVLQVVQAQAAVGLGERQPPARVLPSLLAVLAVRIRQPAVVEVAEGQAAPGLQVTQEPMPPPGAQALRL